MEEVIEDRDMIFFTETRQSLERSLLRVEGYGGSQHTGEGHTEQEGLENS